MSKLAQKLRELSRTAPQPLGFGAVVNRARTPVLLLIAGVPLESPGLDSSLDSSGADATLIFGQRPDARALSRVAKSMGHIPWGLSLAEWKPEWWSQVAELEVDFVGFPPQGAGAGILHLSNVGKVLEVPAPFPEGLLRGAERLAIDAILVRNPEGRSLTVNDLLFCQRAEELVSKPLLVETPAEVGKEEMESLRDVGVKGIVARLEGKGQKEALAALRSLIEGLPARRARPDRAAALVPHPAPAEAQAPGEEEEEDEP